MKPYIGAKPRTWNLSKSGNRVPADLHWKLAAELSRALNGIASPSMSQSFDLAIRRRDVSEYMGLRDLLSVQSNEGGSLEGDRFCADYQLVSFLRKFSSEDSSEERRKAALDNVIKGEEICSSTNRKLRGCRLDTTLTRCRELLANILGEVPDLEQLAQNCKHGPGSASGVSFKNRDILFKYKTLPYRCPSKSVPLLRELISTDPRWMRAIESYSYTKYGLTHWNLIKSEAFWATVIVADDTNVITTVPKDSQKDRPIAKETVGGVYLQLGVESLIRRRLARWGLDLNSAYRNQMLTYQGSVRNDIYRCGTIDLSLASDTVSLRVCKLLLPPDWYNLLVCIRADQGVMPGGKRLRYSKLSSMGNGSTFAVESLLFYALTYVVAQRYLGENPRHLIGVFGDDIVAPEGCCGTIVRYLEYLGFSINREKSYLQGPFKESCGVDYLEGRNVRPVFLRETLKYTWQIVSIRNRLRRWFTLNFPEVDLSRIDALCLKYINHYPKGPDSDEEFTGFWHSGEDRGPFLGSLFHWDSITERMICRKRERGDFLFILLKAALKPYTVTPFSKRLTTGSCFDVIGDRTRSIVVPRVASFWQCGYTIVTYPPPSK